MTWNRLIERRDKKVILNLPNIFIFWSNTYPAIKHANIWSRHHFLDTKPKLQSINNNKIYFRSKYSTNHKKSNFWTSKWIFRYFAATSHIKYRISTCAYTSETLSRCFDQSRGLNMGLLKHYPFPWSPIDVSEGRRYIREQNRMRDAKIARFASGDAVDVSGYK